jgi:hypothetical protein
MSLMHKRIRNCLVSYCYNSMFCLFFFCVRQMLEIKIEFYKQNNRQLLLRRSLKYVCSCDVLSPFWSENVLFKKQLVKCSYAKRVNEYWLGWNASWLKSLSVVKIDVCKLISMTRCVSTKPVLVYFLSIWTFHNFFRTPFFRHHWFSFIAL